MISNRTYIEISSDALRYNLDALKRDLRVGTIVMSVIKSNAYGHGLLQCAWALQMVTDWFAVDDIDEAKILRQHGVRNPILVLGAVREEWYPAARSLRLTLTSTSLLNLRWAVNHGVNTHIELDTGLGRQGFLPGDDYNKLFSYLARHKPKTITGVYTHYAVADSPAKLDFTRSQYELFQVMIEGVEKVLGRAIIKHTSGTSGAVYRNEFAADMVRLGIGLYGVWPSRELKETMTDLQLEPVMRWLSVVSEVKKLPKGHSVGYDRTYVADREIIVAVVPVGYWHGIPRSMSNRGSVSVRDLTVPIIGNISMDMMVIDVTMLDGEVLVGDVVTLLGGDIDVLDLADSVGISHYEFLTRINPFIERRLK